MNLFQASCLWRFWTLLAEIHPKNKIKQSRPKMKIKSRGGGEITPSPQKEQQKTLCSISGSVFTSKKHMFATATAKLTV
jgi:hypothetical protein